MRKKLYFIIVIFIIFGLYVKFYNNSNIFDYMVLKYIRSTINPNLFFKTLSRIGNVSSYFILIIPLTIYLYWKNEKNIMYSILFSTIIATIMMITFKNIFQRVRPEDFFAIKENGYSYPSGHSLVSAATYWTIYKILKSKNYNKLYLYFFFILPILIGFSRLVLGVHWPSDVIIGLLLGMVISYVSIYLFFEKKGNNG